ncbi:hypothetical protein EYF80_020385 [Liparis tanakae]|uniref:Uncharacterized protein n=1 Tax=Liparis tanakae TaxID=230148 RepID=A0A4Z2HWK2_9TELE|nr:hypothetical protein EYF80_020385 [Liparis tanakae]
MLLLQDTFRKLKKAFSLVAVELNREELVLVLLAVSEAVLALSGVCAALLHRVFGAQGKDGEVFQGQHQFDESQVQLLSEDLTNLVALVL